MDSSMGVNNVKRKQKKVETETLARLNELKDKIHSVDLRTKLYMEQSNRKISAMVPQEKKIPLKK